MNKEEKLQKDKENLIEVLRDFATLSDENNVNPYIRASSRNDQVNIVFYLHYPTMSRDNRNKLSKIFTEERYDVGEDYMAVRTPLIVYNEQIGFAVFAHRFFEICIELRNEIKSRAINALHDMEVK